MEPPIDRSTIAREELSPFLDMAAPAFEITWGEQLFERRARGGGTENDPGVSSRGSSNLPP